jgi:hypothetical protein
MELMVALAAAGLEIAHVLLWILGYGDTVGTPLEFWCAKLPLVFLVVPIGTAVTTVTVTTGKTRWRSAAHRLSTVMLTLNFAAMYGYAAMYYAAMSAGGG